MDTPILQVQLQRTPMDCGVAVLAMLLGKSYEGVLVVAGSVQPFVLISGMYQKDMRKVARLFGFSTRVLKCPKIDLEEDTGALAVESPTWNDGLHMVVLKNGLIFDTDGSVWDQEVFRSVYQADLKYLLVFDKQEKE
jgi:ABC-type bacteriocin/lantibiotic exporter with double-glycine peptidase domain